MSWYVFENGTVDQQALVVAALDLCTYPLTQRLGGTDNPLGGGDGIFVHFSFVDDPLPHFGRDVAATYIGTLPNQCGKPGQADVKMKNGLESDVTQGGGNSVGFFKEVVIHELGHVVSSWLNEAQRSRISELFGGTLDDWDGDETDPDVKWETLIKEAQAEFFKDVFTPISARVYNNRTNWQMPRANFAEWVGIMNTLCPCPGEIILT